jgi:hypothetical protein
MPYTKKTRHKFKGLWWEFNIEKIAPAGNQDLTTVGVTCLYIFFHKDQKSFCFA